MSQLQFELWEDCNTKCKFCYLGKNNCITSPDVKLNNLDCTISKIKSIDFTREGISCLGYIGGEFFQGQLADNRVKAKFFELMRLTSQFLKEKKISSVWLSASLVLGDQKDLHEALQMFDDLSEVWVLTSYDTVGRFHSEAMRQNWLSNLHNLRSTYHNLNINITSILTGDFIDKYLNDDNDVFQIADGEKCALFLKPPCQMSRQELQNQYESKEQSNQILPRFFPTRKQFLSFLCKYRREHSLEDYDKLFSINLRADYLVKYSVGFKFSHRIKDSYQETLDGVNDIMECGHSKQYQVYSDDNNHCAVCDKEAVKQLF